MKKSLKILGLVLVSGLIAVQANAASVTKTVSLDGYDDYLSASDKIYIMDIRFDITGASAPTASDFTVNWWGGDSSKNPFWSKYSGVVDNELRIGGDDPMYSNAAFASPLKDGELFSVTYDDSMDIGVNFTELTLYNTDTMSGSAKAPVFVGGSADNILLSPTAPVPIPGAVWLLGSGLASLIGFRRRNS